MSISLVGSPRWVTDDWDTLVDRADACERLGESRLALKWRHRARELRSVLSPAGSAQRARLIRALEGGDR